MKPFILVIGILLTVISGIVIFQDVYNELELADNPVQSKLMLHSNLIGEGEHENYLPPYSTRELLVMAMALAGIAALIAGYGGKGLRKKE